MAKNGDIIGFELSISARDDGTLEVAYIRFRTGKVAETREINPDVLLGDYDDEGRLIGLEILSPVRIAQVVNQVEKSKRAAFRRFVRASLPEPLLCA